MKALIALSTLVLLGFVAGCSSNPDYSPSANQSSVTIDQVQQKQDGLIYEKGADTPYTGLIVENYSNGQQKQAMKVVYGLTQRVTVWFASGQKKGEANFDSDRTGHATEWYENGQMKSDQDLLQGRPDGLVTKWFENGQMESQETLVNGVSDGTSTSWYENGSKGREETFANGVLHGLVTTWYKSGQKKSEENYVNGQKEQEGSATKWSSNGQIELQGNYEAGKFTGEIFLHFGDGQIMLEEKFVDGVQVEYAETLGTPYANGQIRGEQRWINGKRHETLWYEDGQKERFSTVGNETEDGQWLEWYENGQKKREYKKEFGITEGPVTDWYENGQKKSEVNVIHGKREGIQTEWYEDGRLKSEVNYVRGKQADITDEPSDPVPSTNSIVAEPGMDVTYGMHRGSVRFSNPAIRSVSDGTFSGNTAVVSPGASVQMTGNWQIGPVTDPNNCPSCNVQIYIAWVPNATDRGAWPPSKGLWQGMARSVKLNAEPGGTFDWTSQAPTMPGVYYVGRGQTLDFAFKRRTEGMLGALTSNPDSGAAASFMIEVQVEATD